MQFKLTREYLDEIRDAIDREDYAAVDSKVLDLHEADIADILDELNNAQAKAVYYRLSEDLQAAVLMELEEEVRERFIKSLTPIQIAEQLENLDSDDAVDILGELTQKEQVEVIAEMDNDDAAELVDLLNYDEDTAGGLMQTEFITAKMDWPVNRCVIELRKQAEEVEKVFTIYVVDNKEHFVGVLSLKRLLFAKPTTLIKDLYQSKNLISVPTGMDKEDVARVIDKYNLVSVPVVDLQQKLVGRITIDDVVDIIKEEADKDFQMASGISERIESTSSVWRISRARLPWLLIGLLGGVLGAQVIGSFEGTISKIPTLAFFIPLIAAMGGNVGVQSSAIVVQSLANGSSQFDSIFSKVKKEAIVGLLNGFICSIIIFGVTLLLEDITLGLTVSLSLFTVIMFAAMFGTLVPLVLNKYKIDPALATGPFITTVNDVLGLFIYFTIGIMLYGI